MARSSAARAGPGSPRAKPGQAPTGLPKRAFAIIFAVSAATALGNTGLISVLPLIGRSIGIPDEMVVAIFSLSAVLWALASPYWARASDHFGRKPLMMMGLAGFMVSMSLCGLVVSAGLRHMAAPLTIFVLFLCARALFGFFGSASNPATQAYVADHTAPEDRTQSMASLAGAFGLGTVIGPWVAPYFILPVLGLAGPLIAFSLIAAAMLLVVWRYLPESPRVAAMKGEDRRRRDPDALPMWRDERVIPYLVYGFVVATAQTGQQQTLGFLIIDTPPGNGFSVQYAIAMAMAFGAISGMLAQWGIIPMFGMTPRQLLRWGVGVSAFGNLLVALAPDYWMVVAGYAFASLGFGLARPGFTAGSSLAVEAKDQARVAGAIAAVNGINAVLAPAFMRLYHLSHAGPFLLNMALMLGLLVYALRNRELRKAAPEAVGAEASTMAALERSDESAA